MHSHTSHKTDMMLYNSDVFWNHTWKSAQWGALYTEIVEVNLFAFVYRLFHEDFSPHKTI